MKETCTNRKKKNFYSIVQFQSIRNIFSLRLIILEGNQDWKFSALFKIVWKICRSRFFRSSTRIGFVVGFFFLGGEWENCQVGGWKGSNGDELIPPRVWADSRDANARNWWTPWYVCASTIMSLASENRSENISRDKLLPPLPLLYLLQSKFLWTRFRLFIRLFPTLSVYDAIDSVDNLVNLVNFFNSTFSL